MGEIQKEAISSIQKDNSVIEALANRENALARGEEYKDRSNIENLKKLPPLLRPDEKGLTDLEFQVYQDYDNLPDLAEQIMKQTEELLEDPLDIDEDHKTGSSDSNTKTL